MKSRRLKTKKNRKTKKNQIIRGGGIWDFFFF